MGAAMNGTVALRGRDVEVNVSASDIFANLQFGAMGMLVAKKGHWGFGAGSDFAWQVFPTLAFNFSDRLSLDVGCRWLDLDYSKGEGSERFAYDVLTQGPVEGFGFRF